jgi:deoxyhypusine synthase
MADKMIHKNGWEEDDPLKNLVPLKPLDLSCLDTVGKIVDDMEYCAFGARMLGEVCKTILKWCKQGILPTIIYGGRWESPLGELLKAMFYVPSLRIRRIIDESLYMSDPSDSHVIVVGSFPERMERYLRAAQEVIFINQYGMTMPGHLKEGYYPNFVFGDPNIVVPIIEAFLMEKVEGISISSRKLINNLENYQGAGHELHQALKTIDTMTNDPDCTVILTVAGAMTIAKMGLSITDFIEKKKIQAIAATGALMAHGLIEGMGLQHYKYNPVIPDSVLAQLKLNRVTDTLEPETNLDDAEALMADAIEADDPNGILNILSPTMINRMIGRYLRRNYPESRAILKAAYDNNVPVFIPAFHDSELGNDLLVYNQRFILKGVTEKHITVDQELDSWKLIGLATKARKMGIISIGGGVPRNYVQNVAPLIDILNERLTLGLPENQFSYGCRICPELPVYGNLSGCTYNEGVSWRKFAPDALKAELLADATLVWPFLARAVLFE